MGRLGCTERIVARVSGMAGSLIAKHLATVVSLADLYARPTRETDSDTPSLRTEAAKTVS